MISKVNSLFVENLAVIMSMGEVSVLLKTSDVCRRWDKSLENAILLNYF